MTTKLTLTIDSHAIKNAKAYAAEKGRSLSSIIESYLKSLTDSSSKKEMEIAPRIKKLMGSVNLPQDIDYKKELTKQLNKKYKL